MEITDVEPLLLTLLDRMALPAEVWRCETPPTLRVGGERPVYGYQTSPERDEKLLYDRPSSFFSGAFGVARASCYHPKRLVPTKPDINLTNLTAALDPATPHMSMQRLLRELLRNAFALALATRRTLVLPRMWALCERHWWQLIDCRTPGVESLPMPYDAPLDVAFDALRWGEIKSVGFVEHGFLGDGRRGPTVVERRLRLSKAGSSVIAAGGNGTEEATLTLEAGLTFDAAAAALTAHANTRSSATSSISAAAASASASASASSAAPAQGQAGTTHDVLRVDALSLLRFSPCGFGDGATAGRFQNDVLRHVLAGQYSYCSEERNPFVESLLREAEARHVPGESLLITRRNCTGQPANDFNKPKVDLGAMALAFRPVGMCQGKGASPDDVFDGAESALRRALALVTLPRLTPRS